MIFSAYVYRTQSHFSSPFTFSHSFHTSRPSFVSHPCTCSLYVTSRFLVPCIVIFVKPLPGAGFVRQSWHVGTYPCPGAKCCLADEKMCNAWAHLLITRDSGVSVCSAAIHQELLSAFVALLLKIVHLLLLTFDFRRTRADGYI